MLLAFSMPPKRVDDWMWESFSYGKGATIVEKNVTMSGALAKLPGSTPHCSGATYTRWRTHFLFSARPHAVSPRSLSMRGATAMTIRCGGIGLASRQRYVVMALGPLLEPNDSSALPLAMTTRPRFFVVRMLH